VHDSIRLFAELHLLLFFFALAILSFFSILSSLSFLGVTFTCWLCFDTIDFLEEKGVVVLKPLFAAAEILGVVPEGAVLWWDAAVYKVIRNGE